MCAWHVPKSFKTLTQFSQQWTRCGLDGRAVAMSGFTRLDNYVVVNCGSGSREIHCVLRGEKWQMVQQRKEVETDRWIGRQMLRKQMYQNINA